MAHDASSPNTRHRPAFGVKLPELFLDGICDALAKRNTRATLMLSARDETAREHIVTTRESSYDIRRGYTGTTFRSFAEQANEKAREKGVAVDLAIENLTLTGRKQGETFAIDEDALRASIEENKAFVDEVLAVYPVRTFSVDIADIVDTSVSRMSFDECLRLLHERASESKIKAYLAHFLGRTYTYYYERDEEHILVYRYEDVIRLACRYHVALEAAKILYDAIRDRVGTTFSFEISLAELPAKSTFLDTYFFLFMWAVSGRTLTYIAPHIGFRKQDDFYGNLMTLRNEVRVHAKIAESTAGATLSIANGTGKTPLSFKGKGVSQTLIHTTRATLQYKTSDAFYAALMLCLSQQPAGSKARTLFEEMFDALIDYLSYVVEKKEALYSEGLEKQLAAYKANESALKHSAKAEIFRAYAHLLLAFKTEDFSRYFRKNLIFLYENDDSFRSALTERIARVTETVIDAFDFNA